MSNDVPKPPPPTLPRTTDSDLFVRRLTDVIRSLTHGVSHVDAKAVAGVVATSEVKSLVLSLQGSSAAHAERVLGRLDVLIDLMRDARANDRDVLSEVRAATTALGVTREEVAAIRSDRNTPMSVPLLPPREATRTSPPDGITVKVGSARGTLSWEAAGRWAKRVAPWTLAPLTAACTHVAHRWHLFGL